MFFLEEDVWDKNNTKLLLACYLERLEKFRNPQYVKKHLWDEIGAIVGKSGEICDKKFRNLKQTYIRLLRKKKNAGKSSWKWPYFETFNLIFSDGNAIEVNEEVIIIQSLPENLSTEESVTIKRRLKPVQYTQYNQPTVPPRRRKYENIYKITEEVREKQKIIEKKLDQMIGVLEESNNIQKERNYLFQQYLEAMINKN